MTSDKVAATSTTAKIFNIPRPETRGKSTENSEVSMWKTDELCEVTFAVELSASKVESSVWKYICCHFLGIILIDSTSCILDRTFPL